MSFQHKSIWMPSDARCLSGGEMGYDNSSRIEAKRGHSGFMDASAPETFSSKKQAIETVNSSPITGISNVNVSPQENASRFQSVSGPFTARLFGSRLFGPEPVRAVNLVDRNNHSIGSRNLSIGRKGFEGQYGNDPSVGLSMFHTVEDPSSCLSVGGIRRAEVYPVRDTNNGMPISMGNPYTRGDNNTFSMGITYSQSENNTISLGPTYNKANEKTSSVGPTFGKADDNFILMGQIYNRSNLISMSHNCKKGNESMLLTGQPFNKGDSNFISMGRLYEKGDHNVISMAPSYTKGHEHLFSMGPTHSKPVETFISIAPTDKGNNNILSRGSIYDEAASNVVSNGPTYDKGDSNILSAGFDKGGSSSISVGGFHDETENNIISRGSIFDKADSNVVSNGPTYDKGDSNILSAGFDKGGSSSISVGRFHDETENNIISRGSIFHKADSNVVSNGPTSGKRDSNVVSAGHNFNKSGSNSISVGGFHDEPETNPSGGIIISSHDQLMSNQNVAQASEVPGQKDLVADSVGSSTPKKKRNSKTDTGPKIKEPKAPKKGSSGNFPANVKNLFSTGMFDGIPVKYASWSREKNLRGIIKGIGYLCGCKDCQFKNSLNAYEFEHHAGCKTKHPNNHIYFKNGKTVYAVVQELRNTPQETLFEVIQNVTGSAINQKNFIIWKISYQAAARELERIYASGEIVPPS